MTECSSYYQKVYPRVSLLAELKDKKGSFQTITVKNFSHRCPCPIKLSKLYWKCMWREFLKSVRHLLKEVDGFMKFQFHVQYLRISERRLDCIWKRCVYIRLDDSKAPLKERKHLHMFVFLPVVKEQFLSSLYGSLRKYANPMIPINHHHCEDRPEETMTSHFTHEILLEQDSDWLTLCIAVGVHRVVGKPDLVSFPSCIDNKICG